MLDDNIDIVLKSQKENSSNGMTTYEMTNRSGSRMVRYRLGSLTSMYRDKGEPNYVKDHLGSVSLVYREKQEKPPEVNVPPPPAVPEDVEFYRTVPIAAKAVHRDNETAIIYRASSDVTFAIVEFDAIHGLTGKNGDSYSIYWTNNDDPVTKTNFFIKDLKIGNKDAYPEIAKFLVGKNQNLGISINGKGPIHTQIRGVELVDIRGVDAGFLAHNTPKTPVPKEVYKITKKFVTHTVGSLFLNTTSKEASVIVWVTKGEEVRSVQDRPLDRFHKVTFDNKSTVAIENIELAAGDRLYVGGDAGLTYTFMGTEFNGDLR